MDKFVTVLESVTTEDNSHLIESIKEGYGVFLEAKRKKAKKKKAKKRKKLPYVSFGVFPDWSRATVGVEPIGTDNGMGQGIGFAGGDGGGGGGE
jgi:hypothetical protein